MRVKSAKVWGRELAFEGNRVRQLLVPAGGLEVVGASDSLQVVSSAGSWPATRGTVDGSGPLTARVPVLRSGGAIVQWVGSHALLAPEVVLGSFVDGIGFRSHTEEHALRRPQVGALHSVMGYWASGVTEPGIVVMPTGTGKTETMLALMVACRPKRLLVLVPTVALRDQVAVKFEGLGILHQQKIIAAHVLRPCVGRLEHGFQTVGAAVEFAAACNVVVATPAALHACEAEARNTLLAGFTHLIVDEAHHSPARTWADVIGAFAQRRVLLFTATPFRGDGRAMPGRTIFRFPLREAQRDGYFTPIDYQAVLSLEGTDETLADHAITRLREDLAAGFDHILMARAKTIIRAKELLALYRARAADLGPRVLHQGLVAKQHREVMGALEDRSCRVVVCVDMLGEGFDLPALKVAALHDVKKSLSPMIQLIGRFSRSASGIGTASVFVAQDPTVASSALRDLLREDADWNLLLHDITERATAAVEEVSEFDASFTGAPDEVAVNVLQPKMSAVAHRAPLPAWSPERALEVYPPGSILGSEIAVSSRVGVAWFVVEHRGEVRWGAPQALEEVRFELIIMYFNREQRLLFIHGSGNSGVYAELAAAVLGEDSEPVRGLATFRVLARIDRLVPTNIGLLDVRDHFKRFSMHVGSDVNEALEATDRQSKSQTHVATTGFDEGDRVTISAAMSGRFWSMETADNLKAWTDWCDRQGAKLSDASIDMDEIMEGFIRPEDLTSRPEYVLLALEWPWKLYLGTGTALRIEQGGRTWPVTDVGLVVDDHSPTGPFLFSLVTDGWTIHYQAVFTPEGLTYSPLAEDAVVDTGREQHSLAAWINANKPTLFLEGDRLITGRDQLYVPRHDLEPYDRSRLVPLEWDGVDLSKESQGIERITDSIQAFMSTYLRQHCSFDVLLDDDRAGEAADLVGLHIEGTELVVTLVHCKYSSSPTPGARLKDLYEVCGQGIRGAKWRQHGFEALLRHLDRRAKVYAKNNPGHTPFETGTIHDLYRIRQLAPQLKPRLNTILVQPGLSAVACSEEHLRLLAGTHAYVHAVARGGFTVYCSP
ncbi:DEAD/DEAH box helicase [Kitasatospora cineracea]|uniref:DEAD/DEAH box helicase n=1 Tax=Kitasatospora cineracea TaxID=88074 RepID=UPI00379A3804